jgi:hypothetical protein
MSSINHHTSKWEVISERESLVERYLGKASEGECERNNDNNQNPPTSPKEVEVAGSNPAQGSYSSSSSHNRSSSYLAGLPRQLNGESTIETG